jgi:hypothetical protein
MKKTRKALLLISILIMSVLWGFIVLEKGTDLFKGLGLDLFIFILIILLAAIAFMKAIKRDREEKEGLPADDELSTLIKYKSGYYAYMASMYMWFFVFLLKDKFPDTETMLGGGILLSALISCMAKYVVKNKFNE